MSYATKDQIKKISTLLTQQGLGEEIKETLVFQFTGGRETSRKRMTVSEAADLIHFLVKDDPYTKMRNKVLAICHDLGWLYPGLWDVNRAIVDRFLEKHGAVKKPLAKQDRAELVKTVSQFDAMRIKIDKAKAEQALSQICDELGLDRATGRAKSKANWENNGRRC